MPRTGCNARCRPRHRSHNVAMTQGFFGEPSAPDMVWQPLLDFAGSESSNRHAKLAQCCFIGESSLVVPTVSGPQRVGCAVQPALGLQAVFEPANLVPIHVVTMSPVFFDLCSTRLPKLSLSHLKIYLGSEAMGEDDVVRLLSWMCCDGARELEIAGASPRSFLDDHLRCGCRKLTGVGSIVLPWIILCERLSVLVRVCGLG